MVFSLGCDFFNISEGIADLGVGHIGIGICFYDLF